MATYYWVGGAGTWNASSTTNWASSSGGTGGAGFPTTADDVIFDTNSGTGTISFSSVCVCRNLTVTATQAITFGSGTLYGIHGSLSLPTGGSFSWTGVPVTFRATTTGNTLNWGDKSISQSITFDGVGGAWTFTSNFTTTGSIVLTNGTVSTNGYTITAVQVSTANTNIRTLNLNGSTINLSFTTPFSYTATNLTLNTGTSTLNCTSSSAITFTGGGYTWYNLNFTGGGTPTIAVTGANTFNNLSVTATTAGIKYITFDSTTTINGTLSTSGTTAANRIQFGSSVAGTQRTLSVATIGTLTNTNWQDIALTGAGSPWTAPLGVWNFGNNSGITFDTTTLYWILGGSNWTDATHWSTSSGGSSANVLPGPTNDVVVDNNSGIGYINCFSATQLCRNLIVTTSQSVTLTGGGTGTISIYGGLSFPSGGSFAVGATNYQFLSTTTGNNITTNGKFTTGNCTFNGAGGEWTFQGNANVNLTLTQGTLNTNGYNITLGGLNVSGTLTRTLNLGSSTITFGGGSASLTATIKTNLTFNAGTSTIANSANDLSILGSGLTFYNLKNNGLNGSNQRININGSHTVNGTFTSTGYSASDRCIIMSATLGTQHTITAAAVSLSDTTFYGIVGAGAASWTGTRLGDGTLNSGITFATPKTVYWNSVGGGAYAQTTAWATSSGGTPAVNNFPLPQDTAIFDNAGLNAGSSIGETNRQYVFYANLNFSALSNAVTFNFSGSSAGSGYGCGNLTLDSNVTYGLTSALIMLGSTTITSNGASLNTLPLTVATGATLTVADTLTSSAGLTNNGTLTLGANATFTTCTLGAASTTNFSTNKITLTGNAATIFLSSATQTVTGTPVIECNYSGATGTRTITASTPTEANAISFNITAGTDTVDLTGSSKNVDFTGFAGTLVSSARTLYGNLTLSTGMTLSANSNATTFAATSGTKTITTNGKTIGFTLGFNGVGGTWQLQDDLTQTTRSTTLSNGTLDLNGKTYLSGGQFATGAGTKNITFNGGTLNCASAGLAFYNIQPTGFTTTQGSSPGKITFTSASAKTFTGGGSTYNCTIEQAGAGALTIQGSNTFTTLSNSVQPTTFTFTSGTTQTVTNFNVSGTSGNLVTINASSTTNAILSKSSGIVDVSYCSISRSTATGGAEWRAYTSNGNVDGGNNSGWLFFPLAGGLFFGSNF